MRLEIQVPATTDPDMYDQKLAYAARVSGYGLRRKSKEMVDFQAITVVETMVFDPDDNLIAVDAEDAAKFVKISAEVYRLDEHP